MREETFTCWTHSGNRICTLKKYDRRTKWKNPLVRQRRINYERLAIRVRRFSKIIRAWKQQSSRQTEISSTRQRHKDKIKQFEIEFQRKLRLHRARFDRKKLELEMQMKELEAQHQLPEEEHELQRKLKVSDLENNGRSHSNSAADPVTLHLEFTAKYISKLAYKTDDFLAPVRQKIRLTSVLFREEHLANMLEKFCATAHRVLKTKNVLSSTTSELRAQSQAEHFWCQPIGMVWAVKHFHSHSR